MSSSPSKATVALVGTCDTKLEELLFLRTQIAHHGVDVMLLDVGREPVQHEAITITQQDLLVQHAPGVSTAEMPRADVIRTMSECATKAVKDLHSAHRIHGIIAAGGSGGSSLAAAVMREAVPIGFPKLIVSTIASGDTGPLIGETDISMMYSVVDVAGLNQVLRDILSNAGASIAAAAKVYAERLAQPAEEGSAPRKRIGITMFGVTTPGVDAARRYLESTYPGAVEVYIFHATGHGGKAMERLVREGRLDGVLDFTTTEICDLITGGNMSAGPHRLEAAAEAGIPYVLSLGATDMSNFGPMSTVPSRYREEQKRLLYEHNPVVTLMRTSVEEAKQIAEHICNKLRTHAKDPGQIEVWLPTGGVSMISTPGGPFENAEADKALFSGVVDGLKGSGISVVENKKDINDAEFAEDIAKELARRSGLQSRTG